MPSVGSARDGAVCLAALVTAFKLLGQRAAACLVYWLSLAWTMLVAQSSVPLEAHRRQ